MTSGKRIFGAFVIAIALFFAFPVVLGGFQRIGAFRTAVAEREDLLSQRAAILENVNRQYADYAEQSGTDVGRALAAFVPVKKDTAELISALEDIARQSGVTLEEFSIGEARGRPTTGTYETLVLSMKLHGSYGSFQTFLASMESYVRLLNVISLQLSAEDDGTLAFQLTAELYFLK